MRATSDRCPSEEQETTSTTRFSFSIRALGDLFSIQGEWHMQKTTMVPPRASRSSVPKVRTDDVQTDDGAYAYDDTIYPPTSTRRYTLSKPTPTTAPLPAHNWQTIKYTILKVFLVVLLLALVVDTLGYTLWQHWQYGDYPTSHTSANSGHGGTSDLIAFTSGQDVEVIELVGNKANIYAAKLNSSGHRLVTLDVLDVNGDGKLDILVTIDGVAKRPCLLNTGTAFVWSITR